MIDRQSLFSTYMDMTPADLQAALDVLGIIIDTQSCVTLTTAAGHCFEEGQDIVLSGFTNAQNGGTWPKWMDKYRVPERLRFVMQTVCDLFGHAFGPRRYRVTGVRSGTEVAITSR